jgi:catalase
LVTNGVDANPFRSLVMDLIEAGGICKFISIELGSVSTTTGKSTIDHTFFTMPSIMFDAVLIPGGQESTMGLCSFGGAIHLFLKHISTERQFAL